MTLRRWLLSRALLDGRGGSVLAIMAARIGARAFGKIHLAQQVLLHDAQRRLLDALFERRQGARGDRRIHDNASANFVRPEVDRRREAGWPTHYLGNHTCSDTVAIPGGLWLAGNGDRFRRVSTYDG